MQETIANVHERRRTDVEAWIRSGLETGTIRPSVDVRAVAEQFCAAIIGIVYQWLVSLPSQTRVRELHRGLKDQMSQLLDPLPPSKPDQKEPTP